MENTYKKYKNKFTNNCKTYRKCNKHTKQMTNTENKKNKTYML